MFVAEGVRTIRQLVDQRWPLRSALLSTARAASEADLVASLEQAGAEVYVAGPQVVSAVAGFRMHRGAVALARRPPPRSVASVLQAAGAVLVAEAVNDLENLGALFRNAAAFGVGAILLDPATPDPLYRRSVRVSVGHALRIPYARVTPWPGGLAALREAGYTLVALTPGAPGVVEDLPRGGRYACLVGAEGDGLSAGALAAADVSVRIAMAPGVDSLNVATAAAVALHWLAAA